MLQDASLLTPIQTHLKSITKGEEIQKFQVAKWAKMGLWRREEKGRVVRNDLRDAKIGRGPPEKKSPGL